MAYADAHAHADYWSRRLSAALAAGAIQLAVIAALVFGLAASMRDHPRDTLTAIRLSPETKAVPPPPPRRASPGKPEAAGKQGSALPREAPRAAVRMPAPAAAPTAQSGSAVDAAAGNAGAGTGSGPAGNGNGGGGQGGSGQRGTPARRIGGALSDRDYPQAAARLRAQGTVFIRYIIAADGRVRDCRIERSSGYQVLDELTCRLVGQRFRYEPARDAEGTAMEDSAATSFTWGPRR